MQENMGFNALKRVKCKQLCNKYIEIDLKIKCDFDWNDKNNNNKKNTIFRIQIVWFSLYEYLSKFIKI